MVPCTEKWTAEDQVLGTGLHVAARGAACPYVADKECFL